MMTVCSMARGNPTGKDLINSAMLLGVPMSDGCEKRVEGGRYRQRRHSHSLTSFAEHSCYSLINNIISNAQKQKRKSEILTSIKERNN